MTKSVPPSANDHSQTRESSHADARRAPNFEACSVVHDANNVLDDASGVGLGLSSTGRLVRQANGHFRIESMKGIGTRVRVFLHTVESYAEAQAPRER